MSATSNMSDLRLGSEISHQLVERRGEGGPHRARQMGVEGRGARTAMAQVVLNQAQVNARFEQMGSVRMSQRMHMGPFVDPAALQGSAESTLETTARDWTTSMGQAMCQTVPGGRREQPQR